MHATPAIARTTLLPQGRTAAALTTTTTTTTTPTGVRTGVSS
jgi:hypothetical protein